MEDIERMIPDNDLLCVSEQIAERVKSRLVPQVTPIPKINYLSLTSNSIPILSVMNTISSCQHALSMNSCKACH